MVATKVCVVIVGISQLIVNDSLLGFHMDCLDPPLLEVPLNDWYCDDCFESSDESEDEDPEELEDLNNDVEDAIGQLPESRLRTRQQQPQILRTLQSERIRSAIIARMSLRSTREALSVPSTSTATTSTASSRAPRKRRVARKKARRRTRQVVVEYDVNGSDKFATRTRRVAVRARRKRKKVTKKSTRRTSKKLPTATDTSFKSANPNVHELQHGRMLAGVNFNIFQPTNELDYVPDGEDQINDSGFDSSGSVLTQAIVNYTNPLRRNIMIKKRVLQNCTTTSNATNLLDSIMQDQSLFGPGSICKKFTVDTSSGKLLFVGQDTENAAKKASGGEECSPGETKNTEGNQPADTCPTSEPFQNPSYSTSSEPVAGTSRDFDDRDESRSAQNDSSISLTSNTPPDKKKKVKKPEIDMFDEQSNTEPANDCPNFSIYDAVDDQEASSSYQMRSNVYEEENVDLVQMSDNENPNEFSDEIPPAIVTSQPASPDLENDEVGELMPERSYTPPLVQKTKGDEPDKDKPDKRKKDNDKDSRRHRKRELERYNVRDRLKERSPVRLKDKFGRNRSKSRSSSRRRHSRKRSRSISRGRRRRSRSRHRSRSRRRTPSIERKRKGRKEAVGRRSRSRSRSHHRPATPDRRARSRSKKAKKKRQRDYSKEKPSTLTKEVFTSGQNILVSLNFNNQEEKPAPKRRKSHQEAEEPKEIVDITARKKIVVSSKPVAIIDLARSPFRELTPEYQSNVIELSDSDGEKNSEKHQKSPDSTLSSKLYDPFDILNSPSNENVTSSQNTPNPITITKHLKPVEPSKPGVTYNKNIMAMVSGGFFNEENLVSSSSSLFSNEKLQSLVAAASKTTELLNEKNKAKQDAEALSPYSPGHDYEDSFTHHEDEPNRTKLPKAKSTNIFDELFGSSSPPGLDRIKGSKSGKLICQIL